MCGILLALNPSNISTKVTFVDILNTPIVSGTIGTVLGVILTVILTNIFFKSQLRQTKILENIDEIMRNLFARIVEIRSYLDRFNAICEMTDEEEGTAAKLVYQFKQYYLANQIYIVDKRIDEIVNILTNKYFRVLSLFRGAFKDSVKEDDHPYFVKQRENLLEKASRMLSGELTQLEDELKGLFRDALGVKNRKI